MLQLRVKSKTGAWSTEAFIEGFCVRCYHVGFIRADKETPMRKAGYCNPCTEGLTFERLITKI